MHEARAEKMSYAIGYVLVKNTPKLRTRDFGVNV